MQVEIWSDVVCPWCYVGARRFAAALDRFDGDVDVSFRAFELDPTVPPSGMDLADYLARKFGSSAALDGVRGRLAHVGAEVGIEFRWDGKRRVNTFDAHRLAVWAENVGGPQVRAALEHRLFRAYFTDNDDVSDHAVLSALAADVDLDPAAGAEVLATDAAADRVRAEEAQATDVGIGAVPTFVIEGRWAIPGAQDVDTFLKILGTAAERLAPLPKTD
jgi:predicted DsbA family dithiol-disulfide isomerase